MWLSIIFLAAIVVVAMKVSAQGLFGAFIMLVLSICCLGVSFGLYEWLAATLIAPNWKPDYALPIALGVLFGIPLVILRILFDRLIRRACLLPNLVDKIGGWVFGSLTAVILAVPIAGESVPPSIIRADIPVNISPLGIAHEENDVRLVVAFG